MPLYTVFTALNELFIWNILLCPKLDITTLQQRKWVINLKASALF